MKIALAAAGRGRGEPGIFWFVSLTSSALDDSATAPPLNHSWLNLDLNSFSRRMAELNIPLVFLPSPKFCPPRHAGSIYIAV